MTLSVHAYTIDDAGQWRFFDGDPGTEQAGFESTRHELWGSAVARRLGARLLPRLSGGDLELSPDRVADLLDDCLLLEAHLDTVAAETPYDRDYVRSRLHNITRVARSALAEGAHVVIW